MTSLVGPNQVVITALDSLSFSLSLSSTAVPHRCAQTTWTCRGPDNDCVLTAWLEGVKGLWVILGVVERTLHVETTQSYTLWTPHTHENRHHLFMDVSYSGPIKGNGSSALHSLTTTLQPKYSLLGLTNSLNPRICCRKLGVEEFPLSPKESFSSTLSLLPV